MALTLVEGNKYSTTTLRGYVIDRMAKESEILMHLPFEEILGNSLTYDTITTRSGAALYAVGDTWTESTPSLTQTTAALTILGGDADIDNFLKATRSNIIDLQGTVLDDKVKAVREKYLDTFYYGVSGTDNQFSGIHTLMNSTTYNTVPAATDGTGDEGSTVQLQEAIDLIVGYKPTHMVMNKKIRRLINVYLDSIGDKFTSVRDNYGNMIEYFRGLKIVPDDHLLNTEDYTSAGIWQAGTGSSQNTIFIFTFAAKSVCGIQGEKGIETIPLGDLETKDAQRTRIRWYCGLKFEDLRSSSKYCNVLDSGAWTA